MELISALPPLTAPVPPLLAEEELYHVFISYSGTDWPWTRSLINTLESCGLQVCYHQRDFVPGCSVLENMSHCIQKSQKVLLVLSSEFMRSRWCLLEANMSLFKDRLEHKPMVPVLLEPGMPIPLYLCHLTYLEAWDPDFFSRVCKVLCTPNQKLSDSPVVASQPPSLYNGKALQPLHAVNEEDLHKWESGQFSEMEVPDQLSLIIQDGDRYREAMRLINGVSQNKVRLRSLWLRVLIYVSAIIFSIAFSVINVVVIKKLKVLEVERLPDYKFNPSALVIFLIGPLGVIVHLCLWKKDDENYIVREMQRAVGRANAILYQEKVLMGCRSNTKLYVVYLSLDGCRRAFGDNFPVQVRAEEMFHRAMVFFSSGYACCLAKKHFPFPQPSSPGHLEGGMCFCQYVSCQLRREQWC